MTSDPLSSRLFVLAAGVLAIPIQPSGKILRDRKLPFYEKKFKDYYIVCQSLGNKFEFHIICSKFNSIRICHRIRYLCFLTLFCWNHRKSPLGTV